MPLPRFVAKTNRYWINPVVRRLAGKVPPVMLIRHVGRRSGKPYETPVWAFRNEDRIVIALTYGPETDWLRNMRAAGSCEAIYRGKRRLISPVKIVTSAPRAQPLPRVVQIFGSIVGVREFLIVDAQIQHSGALD